MGSSVVTRSCRTPGAEKLPITKVVPSLVSISLPNKGVGLSGAIRNWWGKYLSTPVIKKCLGESFYNCFSCITQNGADLKEGSRVGGQDRVGSPCISQEILRPTCHI